MVAFERFTASEAKCGYTVNMHGVNQPFQVTVRITTFCWETQAFSAVCRVCWLSDESIRCSILVSSAKRYILGLAIHVGRSFT